MPCSLNYAWHKRRYFIYWASTLCQGLSRYLGISVNETKISRNSLEVQGLWLNTVTDGGPGLLPGQGTTIPQAVQRGQKKKKKTITAPVKFTWILAKETNNKHNK